MAELHISPLANDDLLSIKEYIEKELDSPTAATNTLIKITKSLRMLIDFPLSGSPLESIINFETDYRFVVSGNYISFYRYIDDTVFVDRILYARRDYMNVLFGDDN
ncbi:MAG: type II toxin-antitoxin system RelE/ParE family toxin [Oscillospiraceae bacterium]|nr:type II toxin-antitoxin system RelE/ParE family toxin [Oscillospiraceae bacterium]